jgi:hypothetical protein
MLLAPSASYTPVRCLQGKSVPSARSGELLRVDLPYGTGVFIIMCPLVSEASPRMTTVDVEYIMLGDLFLSLLLVKGICG